MRGKALAASGLVAFGLLTAGDAQALYTEAHQTGDDVRVSLEPDGRAHVEHTLTWHVVAGEKRVINLVGIEPNAVVNVRATAVGEDDQELTAQVAPRRTSAPTGTQATSNDEAPLTLDVTMDDPKGLRKGRYRLRVAYDVDLVAAHELVREGSMWRLTWTAPVAPEGFDAARLVLDVPRDATEPEAVRPDSRVPDDAVLSTIRRGGKEADREELELVRPHVAQGEAVPWCVQLGPRVLAGRAPNVTPLPAPSDQGRSLLLFAAVALLTTAYVGLVRKKETAFAAACRASVLAPRALVPFSSWGRTVLAGTAFATGIAAQANGFPTVGSLLLVFGMLCTVLDVATAKEPARGPGHWLVVRPGEAFARSPSPDGLDDFDAGLLAGKALFVLAVGLLVLAGRLSRGLAPASPYLGLLDALALVPLFATGRRAQLPPSVRTTARALRPLFERLTKNRTLRVAPWVRVPTGAHNPDELRLLVLPRLAMPGVLGIEVGLAYGRTSREYTRLPEVLVRVHEASAASARMTTLTPSLVPLTGRRPEERVYRLVPRFPTHGFTRALVERVARELFDRRAMASEATEWDGEDRRIPPEERDRREKQAA